MVRNYTEGAGRRLYPAPCGRNGTAVLEKNNKNQNDIVLLPEQQKTKNDKG